MFGVALFILSIVSVMVDWYIVWTGKKKMRYWSKPAPMLLLLITVWVLLGGTIYFPMWIFLLGLFFGLLGDVFLLFPGRKWFLLGLVSFLIGHLLYILGFNLGSLEVNTLKSILMLLPVFAMAFFFFHILIPNVDKNMKLPVIAYGVIILTMFYSALLTLISPYWSTTASLLATMGALFFVLSDGMLAWDRFVAPKTKGWVTVTYHLAQFAIAGAALIQFA
ncbi:MAG: lysoplasmalogenase [Anaerolineaceae bacterium]|nr:lysoplasmalogenase [Anaerolineaceae bacterium]